MDMVARAEQCSGEAVVESALQVEDKGGNVFVMLLDGSLCVFDKCVNVAQCNAGPRRCVTTWSECTGGLFLHLLRDSHLLLTHVRASLRLCD